MTHEQARELFSSYVISGADPEANSECRAHLAECSQCREEWKSVRGAWDAMEELPDMEPSHEMRTRFYQMLEAYEAGRRENMTAARPARQGFWSWLQQPAFQFAAGVAMLALGVAIGHYALAGGAAAGHGSQEVAQLRGEVQNMRQLVTLSLLQQQSAADRLQGVTWSYRVPASDTEVLSALLNTVNHDASIDVRLSAVDALKAMSGASPVARRGLVQALAKQTSPLVEVAIVDALVDMREKQAVNAIESQLAKPDLEPTVRKRFETAVRQLE
jgi:hypothetical protein